MSRLRCALIVSVLCVVACAVPRAHADCTQTVEDFNRAVDAGREAVAQQLVDRIATDAQCGKIQVAAQRRLAAFRLAAVQFMMARGRPAADYERLITAAERSEVLWQAEWGDLFRPM